MINVEEIFSKGIELGASDIHLVKGMKPIYRINRVLKEMENSENLSKEDMNDIYQYLINGNKSIQENFERAKRLDINHEINGTRLRVNVSLCDGTPIVTARTINKVLPQFKDLGLPDVVKRNAMLPQGLILVTGKSNMGKTTTLNALVNEINQTEAKKILMLENPIEFMHKSNKSLIIQKEIGPGKDCLSFSDGALNALREDCDILVIGEIRDRETMDAALEMAESGHLVFGTLHTRSCAETMDRILNFYDLADQMTIKYLLSSILKVVLSQRLIPGKKGKLIMVPEIMIVDDVISGLIRKEKFSRSEIEDAIQSRFEKGSMSFMNALATAVNKGQISMEEAKKQLDDHSLENFNRLLSKNMENSVGTDDGNFTGGNREKKITFFAD